MLHGLGAPRGALVVMDAGIAPRRTSSGCVTKATLSGGSRERQRQFDAREAITLETPTANNVAIQRVADATARGATLLLLGAAARKAGGDRPAVRGRIAEAA